MGRNGVTKAFCLWNRQLISWSAFTRKLSDMKQYMIGFTNELAIWKLSDVCDIGIRTIRKDKMKKMTSLKFDIVVMRVLSENFVK